MDESDHRSRAYHRAAPPGQRLPGLLVRPGPRGRRALEAERLSQHRRLVRPRPTPPGAALTASARPARPAPQHRPPQHRPPQHPQKPQQPRPFGRPPVPTIEVYRPIAGGVGDGGGGGDGSERRSREGGELQGTLIGEEVIMRDYVLLKLKALLDGNYQSVMSVFRSMDENRDGTLNYAEFGKVSSDAAAPCGAGAYARCALLRSRSAAVCCRVRCRVCCRVHAPASARVLTRERACPASQLHSSLGHLAGGPAALEARVALPVQRD